MQRAKMADARVLATWLATALLMALIAACSSPERKAAKAEAEYTEEKTETLRDYKRCVERAKGDETKLKACEPLLKAVEATSGTSSD